MVDLRDVNVDSALGRQKASYSFTSGICEHRSMLYLNVFHCNSLTMWLYKLLIHDAVLSEWSEIIGVKTSKSSRKTFGIVE